MAKGSTRAVFAAMIANGIIAVAKFVAAAATGSSAMFSEGIHSVADTGNQALLLFGDRRSRREADRRHPFGYGPEMYFWSLIVAMILFGLGGGFSLYEGISHLGHGEVPGDPLWNYSVLGVAFVVELVALRVAVGSLGRRDSGEGFWRRFLSSKDPRVYVPIAEDTAALLGVVVAFAGVFLSRRLDAPVLDAVSSMVIGAILAGVAVFLAWETRSLLVGETIEPEIRRAIRRVCDEQEGVEELVRLLGVHLGPDEVLLTLGVRFRRDLGAEEVAKTVERIEARIRRTDARVNRVFVEPETASDPGGLGTPL